MSMTFFKMNQPKNSLQQAAKPNASSSNSNDLIQKIESCKNFSTAYSAAQNPERDISDEKIKSVIFKTTTDAQAQTITFEYWVKEEGQATSYTIVISTKDRLVDSINNAYGYTMPASSLQFNEQNEVEIKYYGSRRL
jgi:hypothetical protein